MSSTLATAGLLRGRIGATAAGVVVAVATVGWGLLMLVNRNQLRTLEDWSSPLLLAGLAVVWSAVGVLLTLRRPSLVIGWLFLATGLIAALDGLFGEYAGLSVVEGGLPGGVGAAWAQAVLRGQSLVPIVLLLLLYPDGRPPRAGWGWMRWSVLAAVLPLAVPVRGETTQLTNYRGAPVGIEGLGGDVAGLVWLVGAVLVYPVLVAATFGLVLRYQRATGLERRQLEWAGFAGLLALLVLAVSVVPVPLLDEAHHLAGVILVYGLPVCVAIAILRHGMYDIDRVISRTVGYALVTAALAGVYATGVLGIGALVPAGASDLVVAGSTLAVAGLFRPVRGRVQARVDRRFNRNRYDAVRIVDAFGRGLRDELGLPAIAADLRSAAIATVQPTSAGVALLGTRGDP